MDYFYTPPHLITAGELTIGGDEFVHLTHVMRKNPGDAIRVVNGTGTAYDATIGEIIKRTARCEITATHPRLNEPAIEVTLGVAILKNASKFDFLVEKVTELGVTTIVPLLSERTIPRHAKIDRWQKLALAAMKQSCRCVLPTVWTLRSFSDFITSAGPVDRRLILHEKSSQPIVTALGSGLTSPVMLCVGPEGGFSDGEVGTAEAQGFLPVSLGPTRLRTETAAIVGAATLIIHGPPRQVDF
jgi:16S rRNA (uracil1498-N3)-methyltransferase